MVRSRPRLRLLNVESVPLFDPKYDVQGKVEDLKLHLSCRPDLRIQGGELAWMGRCGGFQLELRSIHRS